MRRTLCIYYFVISRMSINFLDKLRNYYGYDYDASNNKKYIVQLYYATIQLKTAGVKKIESSNEKSYFSYDCYTVHNKFLDKFGLMPINEITKILDEMYTLINQVNDSNKQSKKLDPINDSSEQSEKLDPIIKYFYKLEEQFKQVKNLEDSSLMKVYVNNIKTNFDSLELRNENEKM